MVVSTQAEALSKGEWSKNWLRVRVQSPRVVWMGHGVTADAALPLRSSSGWVATTLRAPTTRRERRARARLAAPFGCLARWPEPAM
jgi:hypothetical protein